MYRVEVTRKYDFMCSDGKPIKGMESTHVYEVNNDFELTCVLEAMKHGVDGEYSAFITTVERGENE